MNSHYQYQVLGHYTDDDVVGVTPLCAGDKGRVTLGPAIYHFITTDASARIKL